MSRDYGVISCLSELAPVFAIYPVQDVGRRRVFFRVALYIDLARGTEGRLDSLFVTRKPAFQSVIDYGVSNGVVQVSLGSAFVQQGVSALW